ncbi:hypothetical protein M9458_037766, partial [Cirrhinus mrigala]
VMVIVLGNKCDLRERRQVDQEAAQQWARGEKLKLWEVTVTDRSTLIEPFTTLTSRLTQPQSKAKAPRLMTSEHLTPPRISTVFGCLDSLMLL